MNKREKIVADILFATDFNGREDALQRVLEHLDKLWDEREEEFAELGLYTVGDVKRLVFDVYAGIGAGRIKPPALPWDIPGGLKRLVKKEKNIENGMYLYTVIKQKLDKLSDEEKAELFKGLPQSCGTIIYVRDLCDSEKSIEEARERQRELKRKRRKAANDKKANAKSK